MQCAVSTRTPTTTSTSTPGIRTHNSVTWSEPEKDFSCRPIHHLAGDMVTYSIRSVFMVSEFLHLSNVQWMRMMSKSSLLIFRYLRFQTFRLKRASPAEFAEPLSTSAGTAFSGLVPDKTPPKQRHWLVMPSRLVHESAKSVIERHENPTENWQSMTKYTKYSCHSSTLYTAMLYSATSRQPCVKDVHLSFQDVDADLSQHVRVGNPTPKSRLGRSMPGKRCMPTSWGKCGTHLLVVSLQNHLLS